MLAAYASLAAMGTWYIPFQSNVSQYVACGGVHQRAATHTRNQRAVSVVHLQWSPPHNYHGIAVVTATVVANYSTYWTNVRSHPVSVSLGETTHPRASTSSPLNSTSTTSTSRMTAAGAADTENSSVTQQLDFYHEFISLDQLQPAPAPSASGLPGDSLYSIVTETITVLNSSVFQAQERSPRFENQELYEKIEAKYGAWENGGRPLRAGLWAVLLNNLCLLIYFKCSSSPSRRELT